MSLPNSGRSAIFSTTGNPDCHVILRGRKKPSYDTASIDEAAEVMGRSGLPVRIMVDCSHANSGKDHLQQETVGYQLAEQIAMGDRRIIGLMLESNLVAGRQNVEAGKELIYGQSITDACMAWDNSKPLLRELAAAVRQRRNISQAS